jgi:uncharacterized membrane protein YdbT with pleckstrin-like domain
LSSNEQIAFEMHPSAWLSMKSAALAMIVFFLVVILLVWTSISSAPSIPYLTDAVNDSSSGKYVQWVLMAIAGLLLLFVLGKYMKWASTVYAATNERIITRRGIVSKTWEDIPLTMVTNVDVSQTVGNRALGYGTMVFSTQGLGGRQGDVTWPGVPHPLDVRKRLQQAMDTRVRGQGGVYPENEPVPTKKEKT